MAELRLSSQEVSEGVRRVQKWERHYGLPDQWTGGEKSPRNYEEVNENAEHFTQQNSGNDWIATTLSYSITSSEFSASEE